jgi:hypothetical protein
MTPTRWTNRNMGPANLAGGGSLRAPTWLARWETASDAAVQTGPAIAGWLLPFALVVYLALKGGGYDDIVRGEVGIAVSWIILLGALVAVLPATRIGRAGWIGLALLVAFAAWTAVGIIWSDSAGRSVTEVGRIAMYVGVFTLALAAQGHDGLRRTLGGVATGIGVVTALALLSRLHPAWFPTDTTARFLPAVRSRLNYPLNYWNGLAALVALGMPLMLVAAVRARQIAVQALAAATLPIMAVTAYFTFSRGGFLEIAVGLIVLVALYPRRLTLLPTILVGAGGSAMLIAAARQRGALDEALDNSAAHSQGNEMIAVVLVVCAGVALLQIAIALAARHEVGSRLYVPRRPALIALAVAVVAAITIAMAAGLPGRVSDGWHNFKNPNVAGAGAERFSSTSGNGRYQYWQSSLDANATDPLTGIGPGTWQFWWSEHGSVPGYVVNAHSLYFETLAELGIPGLILIAALVLWVLGVGVWRSLAASQNRGLLAAATGSAFAFPVAAGVDWVWQIAVIPVVFLLVAAAVLGPGIGSPEADSTRIGRVVPRLALVILALVSIAAIAIPLAGASAVHRSQIDVRSRNLSSALQQARTAHDIQPYAAAASLQEALVLELKGDLDSAADAARTATGQEANNWQNWLVLSRLEAERGNEHEAIVAYRKARSLNPRSSLFAQ